MFVCLYVCMFEPEVGTVYNICLYIRANLIPNEVGIMRSVYKIVG